MYDEFHKTKQMSDFLTSHNFLGEVMDSLIQKTYLGLVAQINIVREENAPIVYLKQVIFPSLSLCYPSLWIELTIIIASHTIPLR